ncbi:DUF4278 domain-containing protein [Rivularia sp. UHCC 0363]|uniref:DUF4278 domain-containing protein n=1 Tax=Rivularia sp. UHCC 0363 TaxID=3110244 RepID=UPI002B21CA76|nr:DUF4278 domain-containing protein [Rivularia sp. UHCC 0363]MEA5594509.1 DUF4278 domain-containing protein [Rivularia sp. UHCC 0363]
MKLTYRGVSYQHNNSPIETSETNIFAIYRGIPYCIRRSVSFRQNEQLQNNLKYRGISYSIN